MSAPTKPGPRRSDLLVLDDTPESPHTVALSGTGTEGYYIAGRIGNVYPEGDAASFGGPLSTPSPVVSISTTPNGDGYWEAMANGGVDHYGNAQSFGSAASEPLNKPVVGMASTPDGQGYWLVASDGGIFTFGDARFFGSTGAIRLNQPVVGMASTPDGQGYWLVAADGGIFTFGDAPYLGSIGAHGWSGIVGMAGTAPALDPYLAANAASLGSARGIKHLPRP